MPIGFNLFSFDLFEAFRRVLGRDPSLDQDPDATASCAGNDAADQEDKRRRVPDQAFWGLGCFPVL